MKVNENKLLEGNCFDVALNDEEKASTHLEEKDNILIIQKRGENYIVDCYSREYLENILDDPTKARYICSETNSITGREIPQDPLNVIGFVDPSRIFYRIDLSFGGFYLSYPDISRMILSGQRIFYVVETNKIVYPRTASKQVYDQQSTRRSSNIISADHCQEGTSITVYQIKICGGDDCLQQILGQTLLTNINWKVTTNPIEKFENIELNLGEGEVTIILPVSSKFKEYQTIKVDSNITLEDLLLEIYIFYNENNITYEDVEDYTLTDELDETLAEMDDGKLKFMKDLLGAKTNFRGLKKKGNDWLVVLDRGNLN